MISIWRISFESSLPPEVLPILLPLPFDFLLDLADFFSFVDTSGDLRISSDWNEESQQKNCRKKNRISTKTLSSEYVSELTPLLLLCVLVLKFGMNLLNVDSLSLFRCSILGTLCSRRVVWSWWDVDVDEIVEFVSNSGNSPSSKKNSYCV